MTTPTTAAGRAHCSYDFCDEKLIGPHKHESKGGRITEHAPGRCDRGSHPEARATAERDVAALREALTRIEDDGCEASRFAEEDPPVWDRCIDPNYVEGAPAGRCSSCTAHDALANPAAVEPRWPSGPEAERELAAQLRQMGSDNPARAILAALREPPREGSAE